MTRFHDWPERLARFLEDAKLIEWPGESCGEFCAAAIETVTGVRFSTGFADPEAGVAAAGLEEIPVNRAGRGDLVLHDRGLAIVGTDPRYAWGPAEDGGLAPVRTLRCRKAWKV